MFSSKYPCPMQTISNIHHVKFSVNHSLRLNKSIYYLSHMFLKTKNTQVYWNYNSKELCGKNTYIDNLHGNIA